MTQRLGLLQIKISVLEDERARLRADLAVAVERVAAQAELLARRAER